MRNFIIVSMLVFLLASLSACAPLEAPTQAVESETVGSMSSLSGTYAAVIPTDNRPEIPDNFGGLAGEWEMKLDVDGSFQLYQEGNLRAEGIFAVEDDLFKMTGLSGDFSQSDSPGVYQWKIDGDHLLLQAVTDPIEPRRFTLTCMRWQRV